jgi:hypothetical protein
MKRDSSPACAVPAGLQIERPMPPSPRSAPERFRIAAKPEKGSPFACPFNRVRAQRIAAELSQ